MPYLDETDQANGCAATLYLHSGTHYILAHYGSQYDMQRYALKRGTYEVGNICDICINNFINEGEADLIEDGVW
jgi:hypothetical protein